MRPKDLARFWAKVNRGTGCWEWLGERNNKGYGRFPTYSRDSRKRLLAHRVSYTLHHGQIPAGMVVMHACDNPGCVNPEHLSIGTQQDNLRDALAKGRVDMSGLAVGRKMSVPGQRGPRVTQCHNGHDYTPTNTIINSRGHRLCRICRRAGWTRSNARISARRAGGAA